MTHVCIALRLTRLTVRIVHAVVACTARLRADAITATPAEALAAQVVGEAWKSNEVMTIGMTRCYTIDGELGKARSL